MDHGDRSTGQDTRADANPSAVVFTRHGLTAGATKILPIVPGAVAFGLLFGFLAGQNGLTLLETGLMSALIFAGAAQFLAVELWSDPLPVGALIATAVVVNLRHLLMGAVLGPWFRQTRGLKAYGSVYFMTDESWGISVADLNRGGRDAAFLLGAGLMLYVCWVSSSLLGRIYGDLISNPERFGIGFLATAFFVVLLAGFWRGRQDILPWLVAAGVAILVSRTVPGNWHILAGALAGSLAGAWRHGR